MARLHISVKDLEDGEMAVWRPAVDLSELIAVEATERIRLEAARLVDRGLAAISIEVRIDLLVRPTLIQIREETKA